MHKVHSFSISSRDGNVINSSGWNNLSAINNAVFLEARLPLIRRACIYTEEELLETHNVLTPNNDSLNKQTRIALVNTLIECNNDDLDCNFTPITAGDVSSESSASSVSSLSSDSGLDVLSSSTLQSSSSTSKSLSSQSLSTQSLSTQSNDSASTQSPSTQSPSTESSGSTESSSSKSLSTESSSSDQSSGSSLSTVLTLSTDSTLTISSQSSVSEIQGLDFPRTNDIITQVIVDGDTTYIFGYFTSVNGQTRTGAAAFTTSTGALLPWNINDEYFLYSEFQGWNSVETAKLDGDLLYIGGNWGSYSSDLNMTDDSFIVVDKNTATRVSPGISFGGSGRVFSIELPDDGYFYIFGTFGDVNEVSVGGGAKIDAATYALDSSWTPNFDHNIYCSVYYNGSFYVGGQTTPNVQKISKATALIDVNWDVLVEDEFNESGFNVYVYGIALSSDNSHVYIGGNFTFVNGEQTFAVAKVDAINGDIETGWGSAIIENSYVNKSPLVYDGQVFWNGSFQQYTEDTGSSGFTFLTMSESDGSISDDFKFKSDGGGSGGYTTVPIGNGYLFFAGEFYLNNTTPVDFARKNIMMVNENDGIIIPSVIPLWDVNSPTSPNYWDHIGSGGETIVVQIKLDGPPAVGYDATVELFSSVGPNNNPPFALTTAQIVDANDNPLSSAVFTFTSLNWNMSQNFRLQCGYAAPGEVSLFIPANVTYSVDNILSGLSARSAFSSSASTDSTSSDQSSLSSRTRSSRSTNQSSSSSNTPSSLSLSSSSRTESSSSSVSFSSSSRTRSTATTNSSSSDSSTSSSRSRSSLSSRSSDSLSTSSNTPSSASSSTSSNTPSSASSSTSSTSSTSSSFVSSHSSPNDASSSSSGDPDWPPTTILTDPGWTFEKRTDGDVYISDNGWQIDTSTVYAGARSLSSEPIDGITDSEKSVAEFTGTFTGGTVEFYWKVSSEEDYDFLTFYVDDVEQNNIHGTVDWTYVSYAISAGVHTLRWEYSKDSSASVGLDRGWIDSLVLPL